jgi:hypothetical protein
MAVEIGLIAKMELFMGNPLYAVAVILAIFLLSNGIGAYLQHRFHIFKGPVIMVLAAGLTIPWGLLCIELFNDYLLSVNIILKVLLVLVAVMPAGICLGLYYPFGVSTLVENGKDETVPATYGIATLSSVLGSAMAMTFIVNYGFSIIVAAGALGYLMVAGIYAAARVWS